MGSTLVVGATLSCPPANKHIFNYMQFGMMGKHDARAGSSLRTVSTCISEFTLEPTRSQMTFVRQSQQAALSRNDKKGILLRALEMRQPDA